jgi:hypothetical protein
MLDMPIPIRQNVHVVVIDVEHVRGASRAPLRNPVSRAIAELGFRFVDFDASTFFSARVLGQKQAILLRAPARATWWLDQWSAGRAVPVPFSFRVNVTPVNPSTPTKLQIVGISHLRPHSRSAILEVSTRRTVKRKA